MALMQVVTERPIEWSHNPDPSTFIGDANACPSNIWHPPCSFTNYSVSADGWVDREAVAAEASGVYTQLCARMQQAMQGYCLVRNRTSRTWSLLGVGRKGSTVLHAGDLRGDLGTLCMQLIYYLCCII